MSESLQIINSQLTAHLSYSIQASYFVLPFCVSLYLLEGVCFHILCATFQASEVRLSPSLLYPGLEKEYWGIK